VLAGGPPGVEDGLSRLSPPSAHPRLGPEKAQWAQVPCQHRLDTQDELNFYVARRR
jgi:hypothetical protein